ncbi:MAG: hypothetical protein COW55_06885 [Rhodobacteraceae bacterium CG17_big_fil_post_rev_8_21_14_2_50_65_11]|nr:MAG: hypothetical protein COW55_06885 [Rhodobacteraceae bacterium CG17_big_fil_post_rev_8_21_14_2_50_65_11]
MPEDLDTRLLAAHAADDRAALIGLYGEAAGTAKSPVARNFYLTHAYVYALEAGVPEADILRRRLVDYGAEPLD